MTKHDNLLKKRNVIGYSDNGDSVEVFVTKKYDRATAKRLISNQRVNFWEKDLVPEHIRSWFRKKKTRVKEVGEVKAQLNRRSYRPLRGGCEIGIKGDNYVGTAGGLVYRRSYRGVNLYGLWESFFSWIKKYGLDYEEEKFILKNCHVAQKNAFEPEQWTYVQPLRGSTISTENESVPISLEGDNFVDAALLKLDVVDMLPEQVPGWKIRGFSGVVRSSDTLKKYGRTTSLTTGSLVNSNVTISVGYRGGDALFRGVYQVTDMSDGGDSGSFVLNQDGMVVGLIFAGGGGYSYVIPIVPIIREFGLSTVYD